MTAPRVSVIIPTRNRAETLSATLESLRHQGYRDFEVIVVDDGSTDGTQAVIVRAGDEVRCVRTDGVGAVEARCVGVKAARGDILAFTDDDCVVDAQWLRNGVASIDAGADVVQGRTLPARRVEPFERSVEHGRADGLYPTCNVFYRRTAYDAVGGFDRYIGDRYGFRPGHDARALGFGEDTALAWSVAREGKAAFCEDAVVHHDVVRAPLRETISRTWMVGGFPWLVREIPELRSTLLRGGVLLGRADERLFAYGLFLLAVPGLQPVGLGAALAWVIGRARRVARGSGSRGRRILAFPFQLVLDVVRCVALVVGSVRARTVVI